MMHMRAGGFVSHFCYRNPDVLFVVFYNVESERSKNMKKFWTFIIELKPSRSISAPLEIQYNVRNHLKRYSIIIYF